MRLDSDAGALFQEYGERHTAEVNAGRFRSIASWAARHPARVLRIAALLELMAGASSTVSTASVAGAIAIGDVLAAHAFSSLSASTSRADAETLLTWLAQTGADSFTRREAQRARFQDDGERLDVGLASLIAAGYLRRQRGEPGPSGGRPPSDTYKVNPRWVRSPGTAA